MKRKRHQVEIFFSIKRRKIFVPRPTINRKRKRDVLTEFLQVNKRRRSVSKENDVPCQIEEYRNRSHHAFKKRQLLINVKNTYYVEVNRYLRFLGEERYRNAIWRKRRKFTFNDYFQ